MIRGLCLGPSGERLMIARSKTLLFPLVACLAAGCAGYHPRLHSPGTIEQQRLRATIHDPYSDPDLAPKVDGGRPREYQNPLPEPVRNRLYYDSWWWR
jgi:hypothetical protein